MKKDSPIKIYNVDSLLMLGLCMYVGYTQRGLNGILHGILAWMMLGIIVWLAMYIKSKIM